MSNFPAELCRCKPDTEPYGFTCTACNQSHSSYCVEAIDLDDDELDHDNTLCSDCDRKRRIERGLPVSLLEGIGKYTNSDPKEAAVNYSKEKPNNSTK